MYDYANDNSIPEESRKNMDLPKIENAVREILEAIGEDPNREGIQETPQRVARMYAEVFAGLHRDINKDIKVFHGEGNDEMILIGDIPFYSMCEHHLLPFHGKAHVVYIPRDGKIFGLSKVARIVDTLSRKPQLQEKLTSEIADAIEQAVDARSVCVVLEAEHLCMTMRGIRKPGSKTVTSAMRGGCRTDLRTRNEALALINRQRSGI
ncbi:GTP cyclohydrolase I [Ruminococcaceae bacterium R-25]|jgi:GTP cyclohydrolase I|nr:GTP cyclohydrolase I [Ruminococcaceae bacterium R-25]SUQ10849.1 GTP cyclohydrolase I [Oscillospiraceae bacterium]